MAETQTTAVPGTEAKSPLIEFSETAKEVQRLVTENAQYKKLLDELSTPGDPDEKATAAVRERNAVQEQFDEFKKSVVALLNFLNSPANTPGEKTALIIRKLHELS